MAANKVFDMPFAKIYSLLIAKVERKGRTRDELDAVITWLTGYSADQIEQMAEEGVTYADFFLDAPDMNPNRTLIKGVVCGVRVEDVEDPLMRDIRYLDKLVDELAKGKSLDKVLRG